MATPSRAAAAVFLLAACAAATHAAEVAITYRHGGEGQRAWAEGGGARRGCDAARAGGLTTGGLTTRRPIIRGATRVGEKGHIFGQLLDKDMQPIYDPVSCEPQALLPGRWLSPSRFTARRPTRSHNRPHHQALALPT